MNPLHQCDDCQKDIVTDADFFCHFDHDRCVSCQAGFEKMQEDMRKLDLETYEQALKDLNQEFLLK